MAENDEIAQPSDHRTLQERVLALEAALAAGEPVDALLATARSRLDAATGRGDNRLFVGLFLWWAFTLSASTFVFLSLQVLIVDEWGNPDNEYLHRFRPASAWAWRRCQEGTSSPWFAAVPLLFLAFVWVIQQSSPRPRARVFMLVIAVLETLALVVLFLLIFGLMLRPIV